MLRFEATRNSKIMLNGIVTPLMAGDTLLLENVDPMFPESYARNALKIAGYPINLQLIGQGENGYAFMTGNKVIKVSSDKGEYNTAKILLNKNPKHITKIYDVQRIEISLPKIPQWWIDYWGAALPGWETMQNMYVIEKEYVPPVDNTLEQEIDKIIDGIPSSNKRLHNQLSNLIKELKRFGITLYDVRGENIGIKNGTLKIFDVGGVKETKTLK